MREGGIWAVVRIKCGNARWVLVREGLVSEVLLESGGAPSAPPGKCPPVCFFVILLMLVIYLLCYFLNPSNLNN